MLPCRQIYPPEHIKGREDTRRPAVNAGAPTGVIVIFTQDEQAIGGYVTHALRKNVDVEGYYFLKKEYHDRRPVTNPQYQPDRHINTIGSRVVRRFGAGWNWTAEGTGQWGADTDAYLWDGVNDRAKQRD